MRKVSYTQMRAELSDILDAIRNGETVVVTQRGRPDTVLNGSLHIGHIRPFSDYMTFTSTKNDSGAGKITLRRANGEVVEVSGAKDLKISFKEALEKTQFKHAKIIKALEDK